MLSAICRPCCSDWPQCAKGIQVYATSFGCLSKYHIDSHPQILDRYVGLACICIPSSHIVTGDILERSSPARLKQSHARTQYLIKYAHGLGVLYFVASILSLLTETFTYILRDFPLTLWHQKIALANTKHDYMIICITSYPHSLYAMMTSSNGNIFRVTGHLCGEFTGPRWIPHTKASDAELWCLLWSVPE